MRRWQTLVLATAALLTAGSVLRTVWGNETPVHRIISATARQPQHPVFVEHWGSICQEAKTPDDKKDPTHASMRWEHCARAFNAATDVYAKDRKLSADNLGRSMHYLQDNLAPREDVSATVHGEMIRQAEKLRDDKSADDKSARLAFYAEVEGIKAILRSDDNLQALFNEAGPLQRDLQRFFERKLITMAPIGERATKDTKSPIRCRSLAELSLDERNEFNRQVTTSMAIAAAFTERAYELYLEKVDPGSTKDLRWEFNQSGLDDALKDKDLQELKDEIRRQFGQPVAVATAIRKPPLDNLPDKDTGPAQRSGETTTETTEPTTTPPDTVTDKTQQEGSDKLLPVVARGGKWSREKEGEVMTMTPIVLRINKDRTATLSGGRLEITVKKKSISQVDRHFEGVSGDAIEVDRDHPEIATEMTFPYTVSGKLMTFGEVEDVKGKGTITVTRQADGTWWVKGMFGDQDTLVKAFKFPTTLVLKPVSVP